MLGTEYGVTCEGPCGRRKPDIRYAKDVRKHLCGECWVDTAPADGVQKSGFPNRPMRKIEEF